VSLRPRRALLGLVAATAALAALPATALAAGETLTVTPASTQAGAGTNVTATLTFASGDTPQTVVTSLAPGMLGNLNANPACLVAAQLTPTCQIGTVAIGTNAPAPPANSVPGTMYLVPPQGTDAAGVDVVTPLSPTPQYVGVSLNPNVPGALNLTTTFPQPTARITSFTANFTTLNGQEFTRLPSSCGAAVSSFTATYYGGTAPGSATGAFTPTGCSSLPYAPTISATLTKDAKDSGAGVVVAITQAANESANKSIVLTLPKGFSPNLTADAGCLNATGCQVGTATATSPLIPSAALASGKVTLTASGLSPSISISFPAPFAITLTGVINLTNGSVTYASMPDVPLTSLNLTITGPNGQKAFTTDCTPANIGGTFTAQSGATHSVTQPITFVDCPAKPTTSGSTGGLAKGHPKLTLKVVHGKGAPNLSTVAIGLPGGLSFSRSAISSHKTCTTLKDKKKKCTTTTLIKGLGIKGGTAKSVAIKGGKLVVTLKKAAGTVTFTVSGPLLSETKGLQTKVAKHKTKTLKFGVKVTDAKGTATTLAPLTLKAH